MRRWRRTTAMCLIISLASLMAPPAAANGAWKDLAIHRAGNAAILVEDSSGRTIFSHRAEEPLIPASIMKMATSACALSVLPKDFRFVTAFHTDAQHRLYVTGYGDPSLTSEELAVVAQQLRAKGLRQVHDIILDDSFFDSHIAIDGQSRSLNPYDAHNSALLVNYNTIAVRKLRGGQVVSAEPQTPVTALTQDLARGLGVGTHRINLSRDPQKALLYVGHLLKAFLVQAGVSVEGTIQAGALPAQATLAYMHRSSKSLPDNIRDLLEFSNNLTTNQIFLTLGAAVLNPPATVEKAKAVLNTCAKQQFGWTNFHIEEGSGLSRLNRVTATEMLQLLRLFESYRHLLPTKDGIFQAKTGTLNGVSSLAGYFATPTGQHYRFVIIINDPKTSYEAKFDVARILYRGLVGG